MYKNIKQKATKIAALVISLLMVLSVGAFFGGCRGMPEDVREVQRALGVNLPHGTYSLFFRSWQDFPGLMVTHAILQLGSMPTRLLESEDFIFYNSIYDEYDGIPTGWWWVGDLSRDVRRYDPPACESLVPPWEEEEFYWYFAHGRRTVVFFPDSLKLYVSWQWNFNFFFPSC